MQPHNVSSQNKGYQNPALELIQVAAESFEPRCGFAVA